MTSLLLIILLVPGVVLCAMALLLLVETLASLLPRKPGASGGAPVSYVVLIPAHNEGVVIEDTVRTASRQLGQGGRLLVVADNCSDDTVARARAAGAEVIERHDLRLRAKGYALAHGIAHLAVKNPPDVVVMFDADCRASEGAFDTLAAQAAACLRPVQALFLMTPPAGSGLRMRMAAFAWAFKNSVRPRGLARLGLPCHLYGSGMAFPWALLQDVSFATGSIVEDLQLGLRFAAAGHAPVLCAQAEVESVFPESAAGEKSQRRRWEHGHIDTILSLGPRMFARALLGRNPALMALVLDMTVPPLALFAMALAGYGCVALALGVSPWPAASVIAVFLASVAVFSGAILVGWGSVGRRWVSLAELLSGPLYMARKLPLYLSFVKGRETEWTRTHRGL